MDFLSIRITLRNPGMEQDFPGLCKPQPQLATSELADLQGLSCFMSLTRDQEKDKSRVVE